MAKELQVFTRDEIAKHNSEESLWIVINNKIYDVTKFLNEHPGGEQPILDADRFDATQDYNDIGHSSDAREMMEEYLIGEVKA
uniref:Cytochrome b5 heme-binding domain-containing protein n=1 Tax=Panagrolaimus sp. JU765 TaxID=591449 RepID=A0AC34PYF6_9BILA